MFIEGTAMAEERREKIMFGRKENPPLLLNSKASPEKKYKLKAVGTWRIII